MTDTFQCTRCNEPEDPSKGPRFEFVFDMLARVKTALAAIDLARSAGDDRLKGLGLGTFDDNSARFMSLSYYAGGWPMIRQCTADGSPAGAYGTPGWYLDDVGDTFEGNPVWLNHNTVLVSDKVLVNKLPRIWNGEIQDIEIPTSPAEGVWLGGLIGFISGSLGVGDLPPVDTITYTRTRTAAVLVPVGNVFTAADDDTIASADVLRATFGALTRFKAGDYVFIDGRPEPHGMMIVGFGPPVGPGRLSDSVTVYSGIDFDGDEPPDLRATQVNQDHGIEIALTNPDHPDGFSDWEAVKDMLVPYVVDWTAPHASGDVKRRQRPKPFFHTRVPVDSEEWQFHHTYWLFVPAADAIQIPCDWFFAQNVRGDPNAPLILTTMANGLYADNTGG